MTVRMEWVCVRMAVKRAQAEAHWGRGLAVLF